MSLTTKITFLSTLKFAFLLTLTLVHASTSSQTTMTNPIDEYKGWHSKALDNPRRSPEPFNPDIDNLSFTVLLNAQADPEGFTLAVFNPSSSDPDSTIVDSLGRVLLLPSTTSSHLTQLAQTITTLPSTDSFRNTWRVEAPTTCQPIHRLLVKQDNGGLKEISLQGLSESRTTLVTPVGDYTHLPEAMRQFFVLALEGREDFAPGQGDREMVEKVKRVLGVN